MARIDFDLDDLTQAGLKRLVKQLLAASDDEEKKIIAKLGKGEKSDKQPKNDLADLDEEMHGKPNTPMVEDDDGPEDGEEMPEFPKKKGKKRG
jgi:hypothetical protein